MNAHFAEGKRIKLVREMTTEEQLSILGMEAGRFESPTVIVLDDGSLLYALADEEGNGFGSLGGTLSDGAIVHADAWTKEVD